MCLPIAVFLNLSDVMFKDATPKLGIRFVWLLQVLFRVSKLITQLFRSARLNIVFV